MTKEELFSQIHFRNDKEKESAAFYCEMKGIAFHKTIVDHLLQSKHKQLRVEWAEISKELRSDKSLREVVYKYLATLEEYIRAFISNKYEDDINQPFWIDGKHLKANKIRTNLEEGVPLFEALEKTDFSTLINQVLKLPQEDRDELFDTFGTKKNLKAVLELRNAVSHHEFLQVYTFKRCTVDGQSSDSLSMNIKNLRQLLPRAYRYGENGKGGLTGDLKKKNIKQYIEG